MHLRAVIHVRGLVLRIAGALFVVSPFLAAFGTPHGGVARDLAVADVAGLVPLGLALLSDRRWALPIRAAVPVMAVFPLGDGIVSWWCRAAGTPPGLAGFVAINLGLGLAVGLVPGDRQARRAALAFGLLLAFLVVRWAAYWAVLWLGHGVPGPSFSPGSLSWTIADGVAFVCAAAAGALLRSRLR